MFGIKKLVLGLIVGALVGLWVGVNVANDRPIWANPFEDATLAEKAKGVADDAWKDAKKAARKSLDD